MGWDYETGLAWPRLRRGARVIAGGHASVRRPAAHKVPCAAPVLRFDLDFHFFFLFAFWFPFHDGSVICLLLQLLRPGRPNPSSLLGAFG
jgi:hypothetical protein